MRIRNAVTGKSGYKLDDNSVLRFLRIHFEKQDKLPSGIPVGFAYLVRDRNRVMLADKDRKFIDRLSAVRFYEDSDYYITANSFSSPRFRNSGHIFSLHNIVIDCDAHDFTDASQCKKLCLELRQELAYANYSLMNIPMPNSIVCTGRGIQLWWSLNPVTIKTEDLYMRLRNHFCDAISEFLERFPTYSAFCVDMAASNNKAGIFRLPGTHNSKTGTKSDVIILSDKMHNIFDLKRCLPQKQSPAAKRSPTKRAYKKPCSRRANLPVVDDSSFLNRANSIAKLAALRGYQVEGMRDLILWLYHNDLIKCMDSADAFRAAAALNSQFKEPFTEQELVQKLSSNETAVSYVDGRQGYAITNCYIIDRLQITPEECDEIGLVSLSPAEPSSFKSPRPRRDARVKEKRRKLNRNRRMLSAAMRGESQGSIANRFGTSRATVNRLVKSAGLSERIKHTKNQIKLGRSVIEEKKAEVKYSEQFRAEPLGDEQVLFDFSAAEPILIHSYNSQNNLRVLQ